MSDVFYALLLTLICGLSSAIGGALIFLKKAPGERFTALMLGVSSGVMIYVAAVEIYGKGRGYLTEIYPSFGDIIALIAFLLGAALILSVGFIFPEKASPGVLSALVIGLHNFPEGLATFAATLADPVIGAGVMIGLFLHNIPEGAAIAFPVYAAGKSRMKAFLWSLTAAFAEPLGALIGWLILMPFMSDAVYGAVFSFVSGVMCFITLSELFPEAKEKSPLIASAGLLIGFAVMGIGLIAVG